MKWIMGSIMTTSLVLGLVAMAQAQNWTGAAPLGDVARQLKAQRAKSEQKPRVFTNDDLLALQTFTELLTVPPALQSSTTSKQAKPSETAAHLSTTSKATKPSEAARHSSVASKEAKPSEEAAHHTSTVQPGKPAKAIPVAETQEQEQYGKAASKLPVRLQGQPKVAKNSPSTVKVVKQSEQAGERGRLARARQPAASPPTGEWAKAKFRAAPKLVPGPGPSRPRQITVALSSPPPSPRQDLGYVERADGRVEAIVAEGEHVGLVQETKTFARNFEVTVSTPADVETARVSPPPEPPGSLIPDAGNASTAASAQQDASGAPSAAGGVDVARLRPSDAAPAGNGQAESAASAALQPEPLADYGSVQLYPNPPETFQAPACSPAPAFAPEVGANHSVVRPLGYVEKANGEKEAIIEVADQVYLVHEGELFAEKYKALRVTPISVDIEEEPTRASSAQLR